MSDKMRFNVDTSEPTAEVELSAQDLLALSPSRSLEDPQQGASPSDAGLRTKVAMTLRARPAQALQANAAPLPNPSTSVSRAGLFLGALIAVITVGGALYMPDRANRRSSTQMPQSAADWNPSAAFPDPDPVRFANPFDQSEVFEFPPGTSEAEAHDAVADLLLIRATERQPQQ